MRTMLPALRAGSARRVGAGVRQILRRGSECVHGRGEPCNLQPQGTLGRAICLDPGSHDNVDCSALAPLAQCSEPFEARLFAQNALETVASNGGRAVLGHDESNSAVHVRRGSNADIEQRRSDALSLPRHRLDLSAPGQSVGAGESAVVVRRRRIRRRRTSTGAER